MTAQFGLGAGSAAAGLAVLGIVTAALRNLVKVWDIHCAWRVAREKAESVFQIPSVVTAIGGDVRLPKGAISIELYGELGDGGAHLDWMLEPGEHGVLVGSESSVSRLMNVIVGLEPLNKGFIQLGGVQLEDVRLTDIQRRTHLLSENSPILQGSLRRAISTGCARRPSDPEIMEIIRALGLSRLHAEIGGLSGRIYEDGRKPNAPREISTAFCARRVSKTFTNSR